MRLAEGIIALRQVPSRLRNQFMRTRCGQAAATALGREPTPERWIFIISCYNSGTTLLKRILGQHPAIAELPGEGVRFTDSLTRPEEFGWNRMWCRCLGDVRLAPGPQAEERTRRIKRQWSILYPRGRPNLLEKSIANAARIPFLATHFQPAHFIYVVRDGYAVAEGIRRKARPWRWHNPEYPRGYPIELCAEQWRETDRVVLADRPAAGRFLQVYYEEFTRDPSAVLERITGFLGLEPLPEGTIERSWSVHGRRARIRNMNQESFARLSAADMDAIERTAGEVLEGHGYRRPDVADG